MDCKNLYYYEGYRSYGSNIPQSCQGEYFPGDEPGWRCRITDEECERCKEEKEDKENENNHE